MSISPPRPQGPPLNALRAFEAAARLSGFKLAAQELCVTPGAISQHIKFLEEWAGAALFERRSQGVSLTPLGTEVAKQFSYAFDAMGDAVHSLRTHAAQSRVNIATMPCIAQIWLPSRLPAIRAEFPNLKISVTALETAPNLRREMFDISLFLDEPKGRDAELVLGEDMIFPVCSPDIAKRLNAPEDLLNETWLYDTMWADDWTAWIKQVAPSLVSSQDGPQFSLYSIALEEAKNGAGVLMGHATLVEEKLQNRELVAPFGQKVPSGKSLILEFSESRPMDVTLQKIALILRDMPWDI